MTDRYSILFTNIWLAVRAGTESVTRDLSLGMLRRGHRPIVYTPTRGTVADELAAKGVVVIDDLRNLGEMPDVMHAHHSVPCGEALIRFPALPAIFTCHAFEHWLEAPVHFPQIATYLAVDGACRDRLVQGEGIAPERVVLMPNAVDLSRIPQRAQPLAQRPRRAFAFGKAAMVPELRRACEQLGIAFDIIGYGAHTSADPERELVQADLVFATARCALEALCCGSAVVVCDHRGMAGMVTSENYDALRVRNFGLRSLGEPFSVERCIAEIARYDAADAAAVSKRARHEADLEPKLSALEELYAGAIAQSRGSPVGPQEHERAVTRFLHDYLPRRPADPRWPWLQQREEFTVEVRELEAQLAGRLQELATHRDQSQAREQQFHAQTAAREAAFQAQMADARASLESASRELEALRRSRMLRFGRLLRRLVGRPVGT